MLDNKGFDLWADGYDKSVNLSEESNEYPFAGYKDVINSIYTQIHQNTKARILDIGFGIDFSSRMIEIAKGKMPTSTLIQHDFSNGLPEELLSFKFDFIISTYAIHHLTDEGKVEFIHQLKNALLPNKKI